MPSYGEPGTEEGTGGQGVLWQQQWLPGSGGSHLCSSKLLLIEEEKGILDDIQQGFRKEQCVLNTC